MDRENVIQSNEDIKLSLSRIGAKLAESVELLQQSKMVTDFAMTQLINAQQDIEDLY